MLAFRKNRVIYSMENWREKIDRIDQKILYLLAERQEITALIGAFKDEKGLPRYDAKREKEIFLMLEKKAKELNLDFEMVRSIYLLIFKSSKEQ